MGRLPVESTSLVGRDSELAEVDQLLGQTRLLTLAGPGGCGKTRLALRAAARRAGAGDDVWWVELAPLDDPDLVPQWLGRSLGVPESPGRPITPSLIDHLAARPGLVVLDNCEHLVGACAAIADQLLRAAPGARLLATSREPLGVAGEVSWPVPPLVLPDPAAAEEERARSPAVALFLARARSARPAFRPGPDELAVIANLCRRLDGIPLAIELAAARVRVLSPAALLDRLGDDLGVLTDRGRTAIARHRTLLATMDWSYRLLTPDERRLFGVLSVLPADFDLDTAEALGAAAGIPSVLDVVSGLVEKSLVVVDGSRYRMLETVRRYAAASVESAESDALARSARDALARHVEALARSAEPGLLGPEQRDWVVRLATDHATIGAALAWLHQCGDAARGLDLAGRLGRYWWYAGRFAEGAAWLEAFLAPSDSAPGSAPGSPPGSASGSPSGSAPDEPAAPGPERARALHALGLATFWHETPAAEVSRHRFEEAAQIYRELGDEAALAAVLRDLGGYWKGQGDPPVARDVLAESVAIAERLGDEVGVAAATVYLGVLAAYDGDLAGARSLLERSEAVLRDRGGTDDLLRCGYFLACVDCDAGDAARARARFEKVVDADVLAAMPYVGGFGLDGLSRLAVAEGEPERALRLAGAARAAHDRLGTSAGPAYDAYVERATEAARRAVGPAADNWYRAGLALSMTDAMAEGLRPPGASGSESSEESGRAPVPGSGPVSSGPGSSGPVSSGPVSSGTVSLGGAVHAGSSAVPAASAVPVGSHPVPVVSSSLPAGLSPREAEVLCLVAEGLADAEVAGRLHLSRRTVGNHLSSAYRKLGVGSRTAAIREARQLGLL
jgi:non-specific serine/threonine protein kinase